MILDEVSMIIEKSWCKDTCSPGLKDNWNESNKALGQCAVTALIVNDFLGGKIMRCMSETGSHYYNLINDHIIDLTRSQFIKKPNYDESEARTREYLLSNEDTKNRYLMLLNIVKENFIQYGTKDYKLLGINGTYFSKVPGTCGGHRKLKIYGKLDCPSALRFLEKGYYYDNRVFFENPEVANELGYRPCAICMKREFIKWKEKNRG